MRPKKFRPTEDARHVFSDAYESVNSFAYTEDESSAVDLYVSIVRNTWLTCAKDEAVCKTLAALTIKCAIFISCGYNFKGYRRIPDVLWRISFGM